MKASFALSGKGGTGKTTLAALIIHYLRTLGKTPILAIDADPNSNLGESLGVAAEQTIGSLREEILKEKVPESMPKETYVEYRLQEVLNEAEGFDLLTMGRSEGAGCYCYVNDVLKKYMDILTKNYPYLVMDNEAGMEHLSRQTTHNIDFLLIASDATPKGIETAARIRDLSQELDLKVKETHLIVNRLSGSLNPLLGEEVKARDLNLLATVPEDSQVVEYDLKRKPLLGISLTSPAVKVVGEMVGKLLEKSVKSQQGLLTKADFTPNG